MFATEYSPWSKESPAWRQMHLRALTCPNLQRPHGEKAWRPEPAPRVRGSWRGNGAFVISAQRVEPHMPIIKRRRLPRCDVVRVRLYSLSSAPTPPGCTLFAVLSPEERDIAAHIHNNACGHGGKGTSHCWFGDSLSPCLVLLFGRENVY